MATINVAGNKVYINEQELPKLPIDKSYTRVSQIGEKIYINGFEWKDGEWKRTLKSLWHLWF